MNHHSSSYLRIMVFFIVVTLIVNYIVPRVFGNAPVVYCDDRLNALGSEHCRNTNLWLGNLQLYLQYLGLFCFALLLGILLAVRGSRNGMLHNRRQHIFYSTLALLLFVTMMVLADFFMFRPSVMERTPAGIHYNRFELNATYGMTVTLVLLAISVAGFFVTEAILRIKNRLPGK